MLVEYGQYRKRVARERCPAPGPTGPNQRWALDFVSDALSWGRKIRMLTVVDAFTRESLAIEVDTSLSGVMEGLTEGAHPNHLHDGSCDDLGEIHITLDGIVADSDGDGTQTTGSNESPLSHFETGHALAVHAEDGAIVACGDVVSG